MTIKCFMCGAETWCIFNEEERDWICKMCFLAEGATEQQWNQINLENKERRMRKKEEVAVGNFDDLDYGKTTQRPRRCIFKCGMMLVWDDRIPGKNKFVENETWIRHTSIRCQALQHKLKTEGVSQQA